MIPRTKSKLLMNENKSLEFIKKSQIAKINKQNNTWNCDFDQNLHWKLCVFL